MDKENKELTPIPLSTMTGKNVFVSREGEDFEMKYFMTPIEVQEIDEFRGDNFFIPKDELPAGYAQYLYLGDEGYVNKLDKWLKRHLFSNDKPVSYNDIKEQRWNLDDIGNFLRKLARLSG